MNNLKIVSFKAEFIFMDEVVECYARAVFEDGELRYIDGAIDIGEDGPPGWELEEISLIPLEPIAAQLALAANPKQKDFLAQALNEGSGVYRP